MSSLASIYSIVESDIEVVLQVFFNCNPNFNSEISPKSKRLRFELLLIMAKLPIIEINLQFITFTHVTMESNKYECVRAQNSIVIIDMSVPNQCSLCTYESKLPNPCFERWPMSSAATCALLPLVLLLGSFVSTSTTSPAASGLPRSTVFFSNRRTNCPPAFFFVLSLSYHQHYKQ